ncbi:MAG TPA: hypothetical protein VMM13_20950 [Euzebya sp.]|nr:hypothetical protein [Euzebya sp.]
MSDLPRLRHVPELVPSPLWGVSGSRLLPQPVWRRIRQRQVDRGGGWCEVCGSAQAKGLVCHEVWEYTVADDGGVLELASTGAARRRSRHGTATLIGLRMQCRRCDQVTHYGLAESQGRGPQARAWLARLNGIDAELASAIVEVAYERHAGLSAIPVWDVVVRPSVAARHPELVEIAGPVGRRR